MVALVVVVVSSLVVSCASEPLLHAAKAVTRLRLIAIIANFFKNFNILKSS